VFIIKKKKKEKHESLLNTCKRFLSFSVSILAETLGDRNKFWKKGCSKRNCKMFSAHLWMHAFGWTDMDRSFRSLLRRIGCEIDQWLWFPFAPWRGMLLLQWFLSSFGLIAFSLTISRPLMFASVLCLCVPLIKFRDFSPGNLFLWPSSVWWPTSFCVFQELPQVLLCRVQFLKDVLLLPALANGDEKTVSGLACLMSEIGQAVSSQYCTPDHIFMVDLLSSFFSCHFICTAQANRLCTETF